MKFINLLIILTLAMGCKEGPAKTEVTETIPTEKLSMNGITVEDSRKEQNLKVFILTGNETITERRYKTLSEAMKLKEVIVRETGEVNELAIDNIGFDFVFIHSGDIVKGGKQDRTISYDIIIPPKAKNVSLESFCVEQGRWEQRSEESLNAFSVNNKMLSSRGLKLAAKHDKNQSKVWRKVSEQNNQLNKTLSEKSGYEIDITENESASSLQLALENEDLKKSRDSIFGKLKDLIDTPNAIGYAYAINGEIYGVEVYNSKALFFDLWDKLLESVIVEAISQEDKETMAEVSAKDILTYMNKITDVDERTEKKLNDITNFKSIKNSEGYIVFSTDDLDIKKWVHKSYMKLDPAELGQNESRSRDYSLNLQN